MDKIVKLFQDETLENKTTKIHIAIIIASYYKAMKVPDEYRERVISTLKETPDEDDAVIVRLSAFSLVKLAECEGLHNWRIIIILLLIILYFKLYNSIDNVSDIASGNIETLLRKFISRNNLETANMGMILALNLLYHGSDQIK